MSDKENFRIVYYFSRVPNEGWMVYSNDSGDMVLTADTLNNHVLNHLQQQYRVETGRYIWDARDAIIAIPGYGTITATVRLHLENGELHRATLLTQDGWPIKSNLNHFTLQLPYFEGTPWPYSESEMVEQVEAG